MLTYYSYLLIGIIIVFSIGVIYSPYLAIPMLIYLYPIEQMLMRFFPFFREHGPWYNYYTGLVCVVALLVGLKRNGFPKFLLSWHVGVLYGLVLFAWCSYLWSPAPKAAFHALVHFSLEVPLGFLLAMVTLKTVRDYKFVVGAMLVLALITSFMIIFYPVSGISGRSLLVRGGTVLSPSTALMTAIIFSAFIGYKQYSAYKFVALLCLHIIILSSLFFMGARTQFFLSLALVFYGAFIMTRRSAKLIIAVVISLLLFTTLLVGLMGNKPNKIHASSSGRADQMRTWRFSKEGLERGLSQRVAMIKSVASIESPIVGNGIMSWSYQMYGRDEYYYPHNSLAQLYYELGIVGLVLFLIFNWRGVSHGVRALKELTKMSIERSILAMLLCYWIFSFILSLKQETFMSCLGVYYSVGMILASSHGFVKSARGHSIEIQGKISYMRRTTQVCSRLRAVETMCRDQKKYP